MIAVLTTPRKEASYVEGTHAAIVAQAPANQQVILVVDGDGKPPVASAKILYVPKITDGNRRAFFEAMAYAAAHDDDLFFFEDDLILCRNAVPYICSFHVPAGLGWVQFFTPPTLRSGRGYGLHVADAGSSRFLQAVAFPAASVKALNDWHTYHASKLESGSADQALAKGAKALGMRWAAHAPDLVEHIGDVSAFPDHRRLHWYRKATDFPGTAFDALELM